MQRLWLCRHAPVEAAEGVLVGWGDWSLADPETARKGLAASVPALNEVEAVVTSDLRRARETAGWLAEALDVPRYVDQRLREMDFGDWEGLSWAAIEREAPEALRRYMADWRETAVPGGESFGQLTDRIRAFLSDAPFAAYREAVIVGHGGALKVLAGLWAEGEPESYLSRSWAHLHFTEFAGATAPELRRWNAAPEGLRPPSL